MLQKNDIAPSFRLLNEDGVEVSLQDFENYTIVLYFYPKDNTSGCTIQANEFTQYYDDFRDLNAVIIGISPDSIKSHQNFIKKHNLKIILLSDKEKEVAKKYFAFGPKKLYNKDVMGIYRSIFIIKNNKIVESFYNVKAKDSAKEILAFLKDSQI